MKRRTDWLLQLQALVKARKHTAHAWGSNDCCLFAADCILAMTGVDIAADLRGKYADEAGARALIERFGGSLAALATHFLGEPQGPLCARRGDVVLLQTPLNGQVIGVCVGADCVCPGDDRLNVFSLEVAKCSWRVG